MVGTPNNTVPAQDLRYSNMINVMRKRITYLNAGTAVVIGTLPAGAIVVGGGVQLVTTFNDSGTDLLDIGSTADADEFASALVISATAPVWIEADELATNNSYSDTAEITVTATYTGQNGDPSAGVADIVIYYITK